MIARLRLLRVVALACAILVANTNAHANSYREKGKAVNVAKSGIIVTPPRDWNRLDIKPGKYAEIWTLDGEQLNDVTFYGGIISGQPLVREQNKKRDPLPKFSADMLLVEVPDLLAGTYRAYKRIGGFNLGTSTPTQFLGQSGVLFAYEYTDANGLPRKGEARAAIISKKLYMVTFDAPRLHYYDRTLPEFRALADTAALSK